MIDVFAWIVLLILVASAIAIFFSGLAAGAHRQKPRTPLGYGRHRSRMVTLICGFALWPLALIWAYVDIPAAPKAEAPR